MAKKKSQLSRIRTVQFWYLVLIAFLVVAVVALLFCRQFASSGPDGQNVSLGPLTYKIENDKAVKRTDLDTAKLRAFLEKESDESRCDLSGQVGYEFVVASNKAEDQIFLHYGCDAATSPMFAVKENGVWHSISPTNQFDAFNIPACDYVDAHKISSEIAPVCVHGVDSANPVYSVR